ncbi:hypothetical protein BH23ACT9_BH23ACT9_37110 [soil metagenome]
MTTVSRRALMRGIIALGGASVLGVPSHVLAQGASPAPSIMPRSSWGADLPPRGPLEAELPGDVRFLLVHHTASGNNYGPDDAIGQLQSFYRFHTGPEKGWPDIAYNFLIDRFGVIYEGRQGSIDAPIKASATGGSQCFAVLACFIGDLEAQPPTEAAQESMVQLLTWPAARYGIDPTGQTSFESRGSNRHSAGTVVTTGTIAGHRDMSQTTCPGQFGYQLVAALPSLVAARMGTAGVGAQPTAPQPPVIEATPAPAGPAPQPTATPSAAPTPTPTMDDLVVVPPPPAAVDPLTLLPPQPTPAPKVPLSMIDRRVVDGTPPTTIIGSAAALLAVVAAGLFDAIRRRGGFG